MTAKRLLRALSSSVRVLGLEKRQRRLQQNGNVKQQRPVLDVIKIVFDALLDLFWGIQFAAPAIDLGPAGNAGLDAMPRKIAIDRFVELAVLDLLIDGVRPRSNQREITLEDDVDELRQLIDASLANETADAGYPRIVLGNALLHGMVGFVGVERTEFVDLDGLIVEAMASLLEENRTAAVEFNGKRHH